MQLRFTVRQQSISNHLYADYPLTAWCEILQNGVHQLVRPCVVTICSIVPPASSTSALSQRTRLSDQASHNGVNVTNAPAAHYADGQPLVYISHSLYPMPVYTAGDDNIDHQPSLLLKLYCALASSSLYFPASTPNYEETVDRRFPPAMAAYQIDLLVVATHPLSSYNRQLANHMADMAQSFVDLYVMARERWAMNPFSGEGSPVSHLPWHLASVASMSNFDLEALLPA